MGIFDFFKKKKEAKPQAQEEVSAEISVRQGAAISQRIEINSQNQDRIKNCFIAFDVETTGLNPASDRIIEIGAVIFLNGAVHKAFASLVNPGIAIPKSASSVNHITDAMLEAAPSEGDVYPNLIEFLGDALRGETIMCAHNAKFDFDFLCNTLSRLGFDAKIEYVDTLSMARKYLHGLENYKQGTIEKHFGFENAASHRAASDAENCGHILLRLLEAASEDLEAERKQIELNMPNAQELEACACIQSIIAQRGGDPGSLRFKKNSLGYVEVCCFYNFLKFKFIKKGNYILIKSDCPAIANYATEPCTQSEGGTDFLRVYFSSPFELEGLSDYIYKEFADRYKAVENYAAFSEKRKRELENIRRLMCALSGDEVASLLNGARKHLLAQQENERKAAEMAKQKAERMAQKEAAAAAPKQPRGRAILQMDEEGKIIKEFDTIAAAVQEVGVNSKSIRDAANGVQKRAGGYRWKYKE